MIKICLLKSITLAANFPQTLVVYMFSKILQLTVRSRDLSQAEYRHSSFSAVFGPGKNRVKVKPRYRRSILELKSKNGEYVSSKSPFFPNFTFFFIGKFSNNDLIVVKYISIFENKKVQKHYRKQQQ